MFFFSSFQEQGGQNSNDSSSGGAGNSTAAPGTPNSQQGMRPTPSPTGSSGSRSMSPAVGKRRDLCYLGKIWIYVVCVWMAFLIRVKQ